MFIVILAGLLIAGPNVAPSDGGFAAARSGGFASRDVQLVAIKTITGGSPSVYPARTAAAERSGPADSQSAIAERITGSNLRAPQTIETIATDIDLQAAIVRSITGRQ